MRRPQLLHLFALVFVLSAVPLAAQDRVELTGHQPRWAQPEHEAGAVPAEMNVPGLRLLLARPADSDAALTTLMQKQLDPTSPNFHHWLTAEELGAKYGPSQETINRVTSWLRDQGFAVTGVSHSGVSIAFHGTAQQVDQAFATELRYYTAPASGITRMAASHAPSVPSELAGSVTSIAGLTTIDAHPAIQAKPAYTACYDSDCYHYVAPADFATIYNVPASAGTGTGQTVAVVDRARVYQPDITEFESNVGVPQKLPNTIVPANGTDPGPASGIAGQAVDDQTESTLDVERVVGMVPGATVDLVISENNSNGYGIFLDLEDIIDNASTIKAGVISNSFGACEADVAQSDVDTLNSLYKQAAAEGISVIGITGDSGAAGCDPYNSTPPAQQQLSANYFCASAYVTCMGGTEFNDKSNPSAYWSSNNSSVLGSAISYIPEGAWNEPESGGDFYAQSTGGGVSVYAPTPYWQTGPGVPGAQGRYTPDLSFTAAAHDGYYGCYAAGYGDCGNSEYEYFYGTSAAAPDMASVVALLAAQQQSTLGNLNPALYSIANRTSLGVYHDATVTTSGVNNCSVSTPSMCNNSTPAKSSLTGGQAGYLLTSGYDLATGWGSLNVGNLLKYWTAGQPVKPAVTLASSAGQSFDAGPTVTITVTVSSTDGAANAGSVVLLASGTSIATAPVSNGSAVFHVNTTGLPLGTYSVVASFSGSATLQPVNSTPVSVTLRTATTTTNTTQAVTVTPGQSVTLSARVASSYGSPQGQVQFLTGSTVIGTENLSGGVAKLTASSAGIPAGHYPVTAKYLGYGDYDVSQSGAVTVTVQ